MLSLTGRVPSCYDAGGLFFEFLGRYNAKGIILIETLFGTMLGGLFRMAPEVMKWLDRSGERSHQLSLMDKQIEADKVKASQECDLAGVKNVTELAKLKASTDEAETQALIEGTKAQAVLSGIPWVDAISSMVRPVLAFQWLIFLWPAVILAAFAMAVQAGTDPLEALRASFGAEEKAMASSIAAFWLVDRSLRKGAGAPM
jgi:hypothetical protein